MQKLLPEIYVDSPQECEARDDKRVTRVS